MPLLLIIGLFIPRVVIAILYFFSRWFSGVFSTILWPILGFIFMPYTMLWYSVVMNAYGGVWGVLQTVVLVIAIIFDLNSYRW